MIQLRDYQEEALLAIEKALQNGIRSQVLNLATGLGKTICFSELIRRRGNTALILAHREELIQQAVEKMTMVDPLANIGIVRAKDNDIHAQIVVASVQSMHEKRLKQWRPDYFNTIVIDECHHATAPSYKRIINYFEPELLLGVTATPFRADRIALSDVFEEITYSYGILEGIKNGYLTDIEAYRVKTDVDLDSVRTQAGDFHAGELANAINVLSRNQAIAQAYKQYANFKTAVVFTVDVQHAIELTDVFRAAGIPAAFIHGGTPKEERNSILKALKTGEIKVVCNCQILTEGFDEPSIEAVILARPTKSLSLFTQMVGRGTRLYPGKEKVILLDIEDNTQRHKIISIKEMIGITKEIKAGETVTQVLEREKKEKEEKTEEFLTSVFPELEIEKVPNLLADFADTAELPDYDWRNVLDELEELREDVETYNQAKEQYLKQWPQNPDSLPTVGQQKGLQGFQWPNKHIQSLNRFEASWCIDRHISTLEGWRQKKAEVWGLVLGVSPEEATMFFSAPWQFKPATKKQTRLMRRKGVKLPAGEITAGEASVVLDRVMRKISV